MIPGAVGSDESARLRIRESLGESLLVEAAAGTGKTTELVRRIVNVLRQGLARINQVAAVTFTNKAAGELKLRLREGLDQQRAASRDPEETRHLEHALAHLEEAPIGTIHSFCVQILRERPVEARVDPNFEELDDAGARRVFARVFRRWLERKLSEESPGLRRALARLSAREERGYDHTPMESLEEAGFQLIGWRDFPAPWQRAPLDREDVIDQLVDHVEQIGTNLDRYRQDTVEPIREIMPWIERVPRDYDTLEGLLFKLHRVWRRTRNKLPSQPLYDALERFRPAMEADLAAQLRAEMWELVDLYDAAKRLEGKLDFVDLLLLVRNLVRDNAAVREFLQRRFTHLFVDEFQDIDPLQAEILLLLAADDSREDRWLNVTPVPGKLFLVGDPKQSIYKFRRADVHLYQELRRNLSDRGVALVKLSRSFRSVRSIQQCVNAAFAPEMNGDPDAAQAEYVALDEVRPDIPGQPAIVALPAPNPYSDRGNITKGNIDRCLPPTIVGFVEWLLKHSGWKVGDAQEPITPKHICLLFRRFLNLGRDLTRDYVRALEDRGIAHLLLGSKTYHAREEIETMRAALAAIEWPEDELALFATLKGPLFAVADHVLLRYKHEHGRLHPFANPSGVLAEELQPVGEALKILADLHRYRNRRPMAETVYRLLEATRAWAAFAFRPAGNQALANVRRVIDLARQYEVSAGISFRGFVEELSAQAEKADSAEAPVLEEGAEGVRIMTVHTAKGLEFPVVILADMTANISAANPDKHVDGRTGLCAMRLIQCSPWELTRAEEVERTREKAEGVRVAYVAATRARDLLVVPAVGDKEMDGWVSPLNKAVYPPRTRSRQKAEARGCPHFGRSTVLNRPPEVFDETSVHPGLHAPQVGEHRVVWWDPAILPQGREKQFGLRQEQLLAPEPDAERAGIEALRSWELSREQAIGKGSVPSIELIVASEAAAMPPQWTGDIAIESTAQFSGRPSGRRFGALIHAVLRNVALDARRSAIEGVARLQGRIMASDREEIDAAALAVEAALRHPLLERARAATRRHREYPVIVMLDERQVLEGVIDLAFLEMDRWVAVDFKTDASVDQYRAQIAWYAYALERITSRRVEPYLLRV